MSIKSFDVLYGDFCAAMDTVFLTETAQMPAHELQRLVDAIVRTRDACCKCACEEGTDRNYNDHRILEIFGASDDLPEALTQARLVQYGPLVDQGLLLVDFPNFDPLQLAMYLCETLSEIEKEVEQLEAAMISSKFEDLLWSGSGFCLFEDITWEGTYPLLKERREGQLWELFLDDIIKNNPYTYLYSDNPERLKMLHEDDDTLHRAKVLFEVFQ